ncbi:MAG TPA: PGPGW domain-containing protein [Candidatus Saccharimonadales bacterium]|nr:PGPGW domain-containing protein [Candidatus Saccharimonadales bacterium]
MKHPVKYIRKAVIAVVGSLLLILGLILIPLPGPGFLVCFAGVFVLSLEFEWFKPHVERAKKLVKSTAPKKKR